MEQICFSFNNRKCTGTLFSSREKTPFFYWCYLEDEDLVDKVGECIGFVDKGGFVKATENYPQQYQPVVDEIKYYILEHYYPQSSYIH